MDLKKELQKYSHGDLSIFNIPMIVPLSEKLKFIKEEADFRDSIGLDYARTHRGKNDDQLKLFFSIQVRRDHLLDDTFEALLTADPEDLHKKLLLTAKSELYAFMAKYSILTELEPVFKAIRDSTHGST